MTLCIQHACLRPAWCEAFGQYLRSIGYEKRPFGFNMPTRHLETIMNNFQRYPLLLCCIGKFVALFTFGLRHKQQLSAIVEKSVLASEPRG